MEETERKRDSCFRGDDQYHRKLCNIRANAIDPREESLANLTSTTTVTK